ncbi:alpha/beta hydrolase [Variovorax sp. J22R133]|uniref:alpha/beta hydrolase n=1 Tax=Variovorax brevis TaxID=3053503 RepID=UPI00257590B5|nr:alpha/beta hydrolase [Variovorax sp. J22R133]MDM0115359.1 alpha/beta hydrolase [Variovorax sp. J22R133]
MRIARMNARQTFPRLVSAALLAGSALLAACSPLKILDALVPSDTYRLEQGVAYGSAPRQQLDVYRPLGGRMPAEGTRPLVVFFYGGTWSSGERAEYRFVGEALALRGAVTVIADYRLSPQATYPVFVQDSALAVKWGIDNAARLGADPKKVYVMGHSSGGYNAAMVALDARWLSALGASPSQLAGWIALAGPYDFLPSDNPKVRVAFNWPQLPRESQPLAHASAASPRALLMAARPDKVVDPDRNTGQMAAKLRAAGVEVQLREFDDLNHMTLIGEVAAPLEWIGGPVLPPILDFIGLESSLSDKGAR